MNKQALTLLLIALLLAVVLAVISLFEFEYVEEDQGWSREAISNSFLAARNYLQRTGISAKTANILSPDDVLPAGGSLYISNPTANITGAQSQRLLQWIEEGGHLILTAGAYEENNVLLNYFAVAAEYVFCDCEDDIDGDIDDDSTNDEEADDVSAEGDAQSDITGDEEEEKPLSVSAQMRQFNEELRNPGAETDDIEDDPEAKYREREEEYEEDALTVLNFEGVSEALTVHLHNDIVLTHPAISKPEDYAQKHAGHDHLKESTSGDNTNDDSIDNTDDDFVEWIYEPFYYAGTERGIHFMQFRSGEGMLTILTGSSVWTNFDIGLFDHAYLLWILAGDSQEITMLYGIESPSLWTLLWEHWTELVLSVLLLIGYWLWSRGLRFGPITEAENFTHRGIEEHLLRSGQYFWQRGDFNALLAPLQRAIEHRAPAILPGYSTATTPERTELLAAHAAIELSELHLALGKSRPESAQEFVHRINILRQVRKSL